MKLKFTSKLIFIGILMLATFLRFYGLNWDQGYHLHPDERFLTMVGLEMQTPQSIRDYFDPAISSFNPANIGFPFFVYGTFPLILAKILSPVFGFIEYNSFTIFGRVLSATADLLVIIIIFKTVLLFEKYYKFHQSIKFLAAGAYAISVLPIQLAHFFAVDTFLNLFLFTSFFFITKFSFEKKSIFLFSSAFFLGLALACKITAIFIFPLFLLLLIPPIKKLQIKNVFTIKLFRTIILLSIGYIIICYVTVRVADPYLFQSHNFLDLSPNKLFLENLQTLKNLSTPDAWFPPGVQWIHKPPITFALQNIALFGLGLPLFIFVLIGIGVIVTQYKNTKLLMIFIWSFFFFLYQSTQITKTMRYFIILYPFFAIFAGIGILTTIKIIQLKIKNIYIHNTLVTILFLSLLIWPLAFFSIYTKNHSRVQASQFIHQTFPDGSIILSEHWDDALPLHIDTSQKKFIIHELPVFGPDDSKKWMEMTTLLKNGDYLILSSNRGWGSIPTVPQRYPQMTAFYQQLFADELEYKKIATFTSYPSLRYLGIPISFPDDVAEEAFTVYDHPKVIIFQKQSR